MQRRTAQLALGLLLAAIAPGCDGIMLKGDRATTPAAGHTTAWPFEPVGLRIHPFTAIEFDLENGVSVLEARIELIDQVGDVTKGVGDFRFELYSVHGTGSASPKVHEKLFSWPVEMSTVDQNVRYHDEITRTYLFNLKMVPSPQADSRLLLVVQFTDRHGKRMSAEGRLEYTPPAGTSDVDAG